MNGSFRYICRVAVVAALSGGAQAAVTVTFSGADRYTDAGWQLSDAKNVSMELARHLQRLGAAYLAPDQSLIIDVLDIDLAGEVRFRPRDAAEVRVLRGGIDWPRMRVRYSLDTPGKVGETREETVSDMNYLLRPSRKGEWLSYEKRMLDDWFRQRFASPKP